MATLRNWEEYRRLYARYAFRQARNRFERARYNFRLHCLGDVPGTG